MKLASLTFGRKIVKGYLAGEMHNFDIALETLEYYSKISVVVDYCCLLL